MAEEKVSLSYEGPAVADHRMRVRDLAPSLLAAADLFHDAQRILYPTEPSLDVEISTRAEGSYFVELVVEVAGVAGAVQQAIAAGSTAAENLRSVVEAVRALFELIRGAGGERPVETVDNRDGTTTLNFARADAVTVHNNTYNLYLDGVIRRDAREVVRPLRQSGYQSLSVEHAGALVELYRRDEEAFHTTDLDDTDGAVTTNTSETIVRIESLAFDDRQWRLNDGDHVFGATMLDADFMNRVRRRDETFGAGDALRVEMRTTQTINETGLHVRREVLEVLAHIPAAMNRPFPGLDDEQV